jgi:hypothetical protein
MAQAKHSSLVGDAHKSTNFGLKTIHIDRTCIENTNYQDIISFNNKPFNLYISIHELNTDIHHLLRSIECITIFSKIFEVF